MKYKISKYNLIYARTITQYQISFQFNLRGDLINVENFIKKFQSDD